MNWICFKNTYIKKCDGKKLKKVQVSLDLKWKKKKKQNSNLIYLHIVGVN